LDYQNYSGREYIAVARTLIRDGYVVTVDPDRNVYPGGFAVIDGTDITGVGPDNAAPVTDGFDDVIDARGCLVLPGLINMHQHHWYTLFKGLADGYLLEDWVTNFLLPLSAQLTPDAMRVSSYVAGLEMLSTGTTCSLNHSVTTTSPEHVAATIEPQLELGIRQVFGKEMRCKTPGNPHHPLDLDAALDGFRSTYEDWDGFGGGLVRVAMALESNAHWVAAGMSTETLIKKGYDLAKELDVRITAHISGGTFALEMGFLKYLRETGRTDTRYLMQLGILDETWLMIHGIHVTELDLEHMALTGANFVYTPTSEAVRGGGIGPAANAARAGINTALGTDGPMVDYSVDMIEQMKVATLMQHNRHLDPARMPVERTLEMATINAANALGLGDEIGSIEVGKRADIAIFDMTKPHIGVLHRPLSNFVMAGRGADAKAVLVNGKIVYQDCEFPFSPNVTEIFTEAEIQGRIALTEAGLNGRLEPAWRF
jgi:5-methylthioadenosine/S-adenosylhomocysteine deaminase